MYPQKRIAFSSRFFEYFVVVSVIAVVGGGAFIFLGDALAKARDAERVADVVALRTALELYYGDNYAYPVLEAESTKGSWEEFAELMEPHIRTLPEDPRNEDGYHYTYRPVSTDTGTPSYRLFVRFERPEELVLAAQVNVPAAPASEGLRGTSVFTAP